MLLNGIALGGYSARGDEVKFSLDTDEWWVLRDAQITSIDIYGGDASQ